MRLAESFRIDPLLASRGAYSPSERLPRPLPLHKGQCANFDSWEWILLSIPLARKINNAPQRRSIVVAALQHDGKNALLPVRRVRAAAPRTASGTLYDPFSQFLCQILLNPRCSLIQTSPILWTDANHGWLPFPLASRVLKPIAHLLCLA